MVGQFGEINLMINDFAGSLLWSESKAHEPFWDAVYRKAFPNLTFHHISSGDTQSQRMGIDRIIHLSNGRTLQINEKKRSKDYGDILLEYVSMDTTKAPGWIEKDLSIDYLAYAFIPSKKCYLFPWPALRSTWAVNKAQWMRNYKTVVARNQSYNTLSLAVPIPILWSAVAWTTLIDVS